MAYQNKNLSALGYANGFTLWHYRTPDSRGEITAPGYFSAAYRMVRVGDFILINGSAGEKAIEPPCNFTAVVTGLGRDGADMPIVEVAATDQLLG